MRRGAFNTGITTSTPGLPSARYGCAPGRAVPGDPEKHRPEAVSQTDGGIWCSTCVGTGPPDPWSSSCSPGPGQSWHRAWEAPAEAGHQLLLPHCWWVAEHNCISCGDPNSCPGCSAVKEAQTLLLQPAGKAWSPAGQCRFSTKTPFTHNVNGH